VTRTAFQRVYDMFLSYGQEEYIDNKKRLIRYNFFKDEHHGGRDAIYGLDIPLMRLVSVFKSAAERYGTERRVILLHGPVGSSKSTIARLLKRGLEEYSRTPEGALYTFEWTLPAGLEHVAGGSGTFKCPMHEEPLRIIPPEWRKKALIELGLNTPDHEKVHIEGDLDPACRLIFRELMAHHQGNWAKVASCVKVRRLILSEQDRVGIGTFQPKDEKNQDSTELTGDINYRKIAEFGSDSDPRRLQLRRRVQHRQPRHHRVHRGAEAGRGLPLRPAGRLAGAQDQAQEVRPDRHRRGDPRATPTRPSTRSCSPTSSWRRSGTAR
jgi:serine protein kinase